MKNLFLIMILLIVSTVQGQETLNRPYHTTSEIYKPNSEGEYVFHKVEANVGALRFVINDSLLIRKLSDADGNLVETTTYDVISIEEVVGKRTYKLMYNNEIYYFEVYDENYNEILWKLPSDIVKIISGDIVIDID